MSYSNKQEFVPKEIAGELKLKGFDFNCLGIYIDVEVMTSGERKGFHSGHVYYKEVAAPLYQQVIEWFEKTHSLYIYTFRINGEWTWKIYGDNDLIDYGKVEGDRKENLLDAIKKACKFITYLSK